MSNNLTAAAIAAVAVAVAVAVAIEIAVVVEEVTIDCPIFLLKKTIQKENP